MGALYIDVGKIATYCCVLSGLHWFQTGWIVMYPEGTYWSVLSSFHIIWFTPYTQSLFISKKLRNSYFKLPIEVHSIGLDWLNWGRSALHPLVAKGWNREGSLSLIALGWSYNCEDRFPATFHLFFFICLTCSAHYIIYFDVLKDILYPDLSYNVY